MEHAPLRLGLGCHPLTHRLCPRVTEAGDDAARSIRCGPGLEPLGPSNLGICHFEVHSQVKLPVEKSINKSIKSEILARFGESNVKTYDSRRIAIHSPVHQQFPRPIGMAGRTPPKDRDESMRTCRGAFNVACTTSKAPKQIMQDKGGLSGLRGISKPWK